MSLVLIVFRMRSLLCTTIRLFWIRCRLRLDGIPRLSWLCSEYDRWRILVEEVRGTYR